MVDFAESTRAPAGGYYPSSGSPAWDGRGQRSQAVRYEPLIDLRAIYRAVRRNQKIALIIMIAAIILGLLAFLLIPSSYEATSRVLIAQETAGPLPNFGNSPAPIVDDAERTLQTQVDLLGTRNMAQNVLQKLRSDKRTSGQVVGLTPRDLRDNLTVLAPRASRIVPITFEDRDPVTAALVANGYADALIQFNSRTRWDSSSASRDFLAKELAAAKDRLEDSENALVQYAQQASLLDTSGGAESGQTIRSLTSADLVSLNSAYSQAKSDRIAAQQKWRQAQSTPLLSLPEVVDDPSVQELTQRRAELRGTLQENRERYTENYPALQQASANVAEIDRQINAVAGRIKASIRNQYQVAARQESALAGEIGGLRGKAFSEQSRSIRRDILDREVQANREIYEVLLQRYAQVSAEAGVTTDNIAVVDRAVADGNPNSQRAWKYLALAVALGFIIAGLVIFLRETFDDRVRDPEWIVRETAVPVVGTFPPLGKFETPSEAVGEPGSAIAEASQTLRANLELHKDGAPGSVMVTSNASREDRSLVSLGLARSFAETGSRVLLVDGDLREPRIAEALGLPLGSGFSEVLSGSRALGEVIVRSADMPFDVLTAGQNGTSRSPLPNAQRLRDIVAQMGQHYDRVVFDGPPIRGTADGLMIASAVASRIYVVKSGDESKDDLEAALDQFRASQIDLSGIVLTDVNPRRTGRKYPVNQPVAASAA